MCPNCWKTRLWSQSCLEPSQSGLRAAVSELRSQSCINAVSFLVSWHTHVPRRALSAPTLPYQPHPWSRRHATAAGQAPALQVLGRPRTWAAGRSGVLVRYALLCLPRHHPCDHQPAHHCGRGCTDKPTGGGAAGGPAFAGEAAEGAGAHSVAAVAVAITATAVGRWARKD
eukprot:364251-Chlamydomonas_euryale.AAC.9